VERLFDGLNSLSDADRFIPAKAHLSLYRLCEEWCQLGHQSEIVKQRLIYMQRSATEAVSSPSERGEAVVLFQKETKVLSKAAIAAMASLCVSYLTGDGEKILNILLGKSVLSARLVFGISYGWTTGIYEGFGSKGDAGSDTRRAGFHG
jgi:hypothetical protein